jgi:hypothetical protein
MKRTAKLQLNRETIRTLGDASLRNVRGAQVPNSGLTVCEACSPSDAMPQHCATYICSGQQSCDPVACTISTSGVGTLH